jgi:hypothetical protein
MMDKDLDGKKRFDGSIMNHVEVDRGVARVWKTDARYGHEWGDTPAIQLTFATNNESGGEYLMVVSPRVAHILADALADFATPKKPRPAFTAADLGCYIDGAFGMQYALVKMREHMAVLPGSSDLCMEYDTGLDDDEKPEWLDAATELLQDHTEDGLVWYWEAGDLVLLRREQLEGGAR